MEGIFFFDRRRELFFIGFLVYDLFYFLGILYGVLYWVFILRCIESYRFRFTNEDIEADRWVFVSGKWGFGFEF